MPYSDSTLFVTCFECFREIRLKSALKINGHMLKFYLMLPCDTEAVVFMYHVLKVAAYMDISTTKDDKTMI